MKAKLLRILSVCAAAVIASVTLCSCGNSGVTVDEKHFKGPAFREIVRQYFDITHDGKLDSDEIARVTELDLEELAYDLDEYFWREIGISSNYDSDYIPIYYLDGIEYFTELSYLCIDDLSLNSVDLSKNKKLEDLDCDDCGLTEIILGKNEVLESVSCYANKLKKLDLPGCPSITYLDCASNGLTDLDLSKNGELSYLECGGNDFDTLDLRKNNKLAYLNCSFGDITGLYLDSKELTQLNCVGNKLTNLDLSKCPLVPRNGETGYDEERGYSSFTCDETTKITR